jgi:threonine/homoserine/homoserine lactone efflux protein
MFAANTEKLSRVDRQLMSFEHWIAFVAASAVLLAIPGPTVLLVVSYSLGHGRRAATATVGGVALGDFTAMTASMLGLGALLAASAALFMILKWVGAAYLTYLGIRLWCAPVAATLDDRSAAVRAGERPFRIFMHTYVVTTLNPKGIVFFVAFLPQFLDLARPIVFQMIIFEITFLFLATLNAAAETTHAAPGEPGRRFAHDWRRPPGRQLEESGCGVIADFTNILTC